MNIQFCQAERRPNTRVSIVSLPGKRSEASMPVIASGGVSSARDLDSLRRRGAAGAIVGKALWEGILTLEEALGDACP